MPAEPATEYLRAQVETASPCGLIVILYEGAINFMEKALEGFKETSPTERIERINNSLLRAQDIITELAACLDMEAGGEIAENLFRLYDYMHRRLIEANVRKQPEPIKEVIGLMSDLKEAWQQISMQENGASTPGRLSLVS